MSADRPPIEARLAAAGLPSLPRLAWLEIDLDALAANLAATRAALGDGVRIAAVVKADAYGHGLLPVARALAAAGADRLCVATLDEALALAGARLGPPVLLLFQPPVDGLAAAARAGVEVTIGAEEGLEELLATAPRLAVDADERVGGVPPPAGSAPFARNGVRPLRVHLEVDTGLRRAGVFPERAGAVAARLLAAPGVELVGTWTHLASAHDAADSAAQVARFEVAWAGITAAGARGLVRHVAATGGVLAATGPRADMVRPGLMLYGLLPDGLPIAPHMAPLAAALQPVMSLHARALRVTDLPPGDAVGYGGRWRATRPSRVATLPVGYGDGWSYDSAGRTVALVRGRRVPLVGSVAMDAIGADVTDVPGVGPGDEFVLFGSQGEERIAALDVARQRTTIPWEVVTSMAQRLPRVYDAGGEVVGLRTAASETWRHGTRGA